MCFLMYLKTQYEERKMSTDEEMLDKVKLLNILLNQGVEYINKYSASKRHIRDFSNKLKQYGCVSITREGKRQLCVKRKIKPQKMLDKIFKVEVFRVVYLELQKQKLKHPNS